MSIPEENHTAEIKDALAKYRVGPHKGGYPTELRERAIACVHRMRSHGVTFETIAARLGVSGATARDWGHRTATMTEPDPMRPAINEDRFSLVPVVVREDKPQQSNQFEVAFPNGAVVRASGFADSALAMAIQALVSKSS